MKNCTDWYTIAQTLTDEIFSIRNIFGCKCGEREHHARRERKSYVEDIFRREYRFPGLASFTRTLADISQDALYREAFSFNSQGLNDHEENIGYCLRRR
ncbi:MAG: hypothetical protein IJU76_05020 [Desulfovibrionaceae bacterium]|nr:hypothetical protein [Desulfovibrionaceae bacterium]